MQRLFHPRLATFLWALLAVAVVAIARWALDPILHDRIPLLFFCLAVTFVAWQGGTTVTLFTVALSLLVADYFFVANRHGHRIPDPVRQVGAVVFLLWSTLTAQLMNRLRRAEQDAFAIAEQLQRRNRHLEAEIERRSRAESGRRQAEQEADRSRGLLEAIQQAQARFIADREGGHVFADLLDHLLRITQSEYGFIGEVLRSPDGRPYLKAHAITNIAWDEPSQAFYAQNAPDGLEFHNLQTLFGAVLTSERPVLANDPAGDPRRGGIPSGHPELHAFLGLPLHKGRALLGMVGIANRPGGYDQPLVEFLEPFLSTCATLIDAHRTERRRQREEARAQGLLGSAPDGIVVVDRAGTIVLANTRIEQLFGYPPAELIGQKVEILVPEPFRTGHRILREAFFANPRQGLMGAGRELQGRHRDGRAFPVEISLSVLETEEGILVSGAIRDITDRKKIEEALRVSESRFHAYMNHSPLIAFLKDADGRLLWVNRAFERAFAMTLPQWQGKTDAEIWPVETAKELRDNDVAILAGGVPVEVEETVQREDGLQSWISYKFPFRDATGQLLLAGMAIDVTARRRAEEQLRASLHEKSVLLEEVHHRVKNNLQLVGSLLSLQASEHPDSRVIAAFRESQNRIRTMTLIHESLYRSQNLEHVDVPEHVSSLCAHLYRSFGVDPGHVRLELDVEPLILDMDQVIPCGLIVNELVSNALEHAFPDGRKGRMRLSLTTGSAQARLVVEDDGVGFPEGLEVHRASTLGLQLVQTLASQLCGSFEVASRQPTRLVVTFPFESSSRRACP